MAPIQPRLMTDPNACPERADDKPHHVVKLGIDSAWWCTFCGARDLPAPTDRKPWE
jgi:hypothetical protein